MSPITSTLANGSTYGYRTLASGSLSYIAVGGQAVVNNAIYVYPFNNGFGTIYSNPASSQGSSISEVNFNSAGNVLAAAIAGSPYVVAYAWSSSGFGTRFSNPATLPTGEAYSVSWRTGDSAILVAHRNSPYLTAYPWSGSGYGTKYANPATLPSNDSQGAQWTNDGAKVVVGYENSPYMLTYDWSSGWGSTVTTASGFAEPRKIRFNSAGTAVAQSYNGSQRVAAWPWSGGTWGSRYANPATMPTGSSLDLAWSPSGADLAVAHNTTPFISVYPFSGGFGTKYANPSTLPAGNGKGVAFNGDGSAIAVAHVTSPYISAYPWAAGFGTKYANPTTLPNIGEGWTVKFK